MRRRWSVAVLSVLLLAAVPGLATAQGTIFDLLDGTVLPDQKGTPDDLELSPTELVSATRRVEDLHAGIVLLDPRAAGDAARRTEAIATAATKRLESAGMIVDRCQVDSGTSAAGCVDELFQAGVMEIILIGDFGDLTAATEVPIRNRLTVVSVGDTTIAEGGVTLTVDAVSAGTQQGVAAGRSLAVAPSKRKGNALLLAAEDPEKNDPVREAAEAGLHRTAPAVKIARRAGPVQIHTADELAAQLKGKPPITVATGQGLLLDGADVDSIVGLPEKLKLIAWTCSPAVLDILDFATQLRGCVTSAEDVAGQAAADVLLTIKSSRDVPGLIQLPVYIYRGTIPVGPGAVELGRAFAGAYPPVTEDEQAKAAAALAGKVVGIVVPVEPGDSEPASQKLIREGVEAAATAAGATIERCVGKDAKASACVKDLTRDDVAAILPIGTRADLTAAATAAVKEDIMVIGVNEVTLGDAGVAYVIVNPRTVARLSGRMAGAYADRTWKTLPVDAVTFNDVGAGDDDTISAAVERALVHTDPDVSVVARLGSKGKSKVASAVKTMLRKYPSAWLIVGKNGPAAAPVLIKYKTASPEIVIYAQDCNADIVAAIDAGKDTGGRIKGCVDRNPEGMGLLAGQVLTRMASGARVPEVVETPVLPYEPGLR